MYQINTDLSRRTFLKQGAAAASMLLTRPTYAARNEGLHERPDHILRISPLSLEIAPGKIITTYAYNGTVPGPVLRLREGKPVSIRVINNTNHDDIVHWHGLQDASVEDGATEEGSPIIPGHGGSLLYRLSPKPHGTRWYHSHAMTGHDLTLGTYTGMFGFLIVEPAGDPGAYDREVLLAAHHWKGRWGKPPMAADGMPSDHGLSVAYEAASFNGHSLGHGEPVRVRHGERVLFRLLNASATKSMAIALPGHRFTVIALDGNPVPTPATVDVVSLTAAERADVIVHMDRPGVWVMGDTSEANRKLGLGVIVEYAGQSGKPVWEDPPKATWDYTLFGRNVSPSISAAAPVPDEILRLRLEKIGTAPDGHDRWAINGKCWPDGDPLFTVEQGKRYRLLMDNRSSDGHPMHLHRHSFEVMDMNGKATSGLRKDVLNVPRLTTATVDFVADNPGPTLFHCHQQDHMDEGMMGLIRYR